MHVVLAPENDSTRGALLREATCIITNPMQDNALFAGGARLSSNTPCTICLEPFGEGEVATALPG